MSAGSARVLARPLARPSEPEPQETPRLRCPERAAQSWVVLPDSPRPECPPPLLDLHLVDRQPSFRVMVRLALSGHIPGSPRLIRCPSRRLLRPCRPRGRLPRLARRQARTLSSVPALRTASPSAPPCPRPGKRGTATPRVPALVRSLRATESDSCNNAATGPSCTDVSQVFLGSAANACAVLGPQRRKLRACVTRAAHHRSAQLTHRAHPVTRRNSRSRLFSSPTLIPPTLA